MPLGAVDAARVVTDAHYATHSKRARDAAPASPSAPATKRCKVAEEPAADGRAAPASHAAGDDSSSQQADLDDVRRRIEAQIDLEILLHHNELRLIEREMAKCQIALEQLRRCELIPFPGTDSLSEDVSLGVGPAMSPPPGYSHPPHPAPWGVTDGPYTRHYAQWLIHDPAFDPIPVQTDDLQPQQEPQKPRDSRRTRASAVNLGERRPHARSWYPGTSPLAQSPRANKNASPRPTPLLHRRSNDGKLVRLLCETCGHSNFCNTQGFLNHCRIKHNRSFKSHDEAIAACGVNVDESELPRNPAPEANSRPAAAQHPATNSARYPPPRSLVHPLVRTNPPQLARVPYRDYSWAQPGGAGKAQPMEPPSPRPAPSQTFVPAQQTPYMNAKLNKTGFPGDFNAIVETMRQPISGLDGNASDQEDDDSTAIVASQQPSRGALGGPRKQDVSHPRCQPNRDSVGAAPPHTSLSLNSQPSSGRLARNPPPPVHVNNDANSRSSDVAHASTYRSPVELSPYATEPNPGLVSDHGDEDDETDAEAHDSAAVAHAPHMQLRSGLARLSSQHRMPRDHGLGITTGDTAASALHRGHQDHVMVDVQDGSDVDAGAEEEADHAKGE